MRAREGTDVRAGRIVFAVLALLAVSCRPDEGAVVSGTSGIALPGRVIWAVSMHPERCSETACQATYRVRISNPTNEDLFVKSCQVANPRSHAITTLPITGLAGLSIHARGTRIWTASFQLRASPTSIHELAGAKLRCAGEDRPDDIPA
jgi:hypothetical protein